MMNTQVLVRTSTRMWSPTASLKPIAARLGPLVATAHDTGDTIQSRAGKHPPRRAPENYLSTTEATTTDLSTVRGQVAQFIAMIESEPAISRMIDEHTIDVVVWTAVFGDQGAASFDDLNIDMAPFGPRIGLVLENYADFDEEGNPRKLLIGPSASR